MAGSLTLIKRRAAAVVVRDFWKMTRSQQEALRSEGINRHEWERRPLGGHAACSCIEHGRLVDGRDL